MNSEFLADFFARLGDRIYFLSALFLVFIAILGYFVFGILKLLPLNRSLKKLNGKLTERGSDLAGGIVALFDESLHPGIRNAWAAYCDDCKVAGNEKGAPDIRDYFNQDMISAAAARKTAEAVPGILSMTGIIGALLGMAAGLAQDNHASAPGLVSVSTLFSAVLASVIIYVLSLILSMLYQIFDRTLFHSTVMQLNAFVDRVVPVVPPAKDTLQILLGEQRCLRESIGRLGDDISARLKAFVVKDLVPSVYRAFDESISSRLTPSIKSMADMISRLSEATLAAQKNGIQVMADNFANRLISATGLEFEKLAKGLGRILENKAAQDEAVSLLIRRLSESAELQREVNSGFAGLVGSIGSYQKGTAELNALMAEGMESMRRFNEDLRELVKADKSTAQELDAQRLALQRQGSDYFGKMDEHLQKMFEDLNIQLEAAFTRFNDITRSAFERLDKTLNDSVEGMTVNFKTVMDNMDDQVRDISIYAKGISEEVGVLNDRLENAVGELGEQMKAGVVRTMDVFDDGLGEICERFARTIADMKDAVEDIPALIQSIKKGEDDKQEMAV